MALSKRLRRHKGWIALSALLVVGAGAYLAYASSRPKADTVSYTTATATKGTLSVTVSGTGNLEVDGAVEVYPATSGTVASVAVEHGDKVTTGTVLFRLDASTAKAATAKALASLRQAEQQVAQASLQVTQAGNELAALEDRSELPSSTVTSEDVALAEAKLAAAKAQLAAAKASRSTAAIEYDNARAAEGKLLVKAPCSGIVWELNVSAGDAVSQSTGGGSAAASSGFASSGQSATAGASSSESGAPVVIAPSQPLAVHLLVSEADVPSLRIGQRAQIAFDALPEVTATGKVYKIADTGSSTSGVVTFDVWVSLDIADPRLREGMSATAKIVTDIARNALLVPNAAVKSAPDGASYVLVLRAGSHEPEQVTVTTGLANDSYTQILSGLNVGDAIVTQTIDSSTSNSSATQNRSGGFMMPGMGGGSPRD
ncbi:efflux RND transporter periplasmic adaptor subunit [Coriobacteriia bacterium Es71-Z0120]|uniref:efflux RND transporter periplasmic adaptor subunit n=1 Tax=Parvivirga hydrogeniphila TaxID=2939460 RepID=UPI002260B715|nr:efflux RND transporter periplasmic adaptor subunit [Parvivirga hydrogeniphila]MCL4078062.1 efflux RND transporter periplasmic adaptor subunit [Parvivirga hydrogeniphila]